MHKTSYTLTVFRQYTNRIDPETALKGVKQSATSGIGKVLAERGGWSASKPVLTIEENPTGYLYAARITFRHSSARSFTVASADRQFSVITERFFRRVKKFSWYTEPVIENAVQNLAPKNDRPQVVEKAPVPSGPDAIVIPANWRDYFADIYMRNDQIEEIMESIRTFKDTNGEIRNHILLWGAPGCIAGDSFIHYEVRNNGERRNSKGGTIESLYRRFNGIGYYKSSKESFRVQSIDSNGKVFMNTVTNVVFSGVKKVYEIKTERGNSLKATADHEFLTEGGYTALSNLRVNDTVFIDPKRVAEKGGKNQKYRKEIFVKTHPTAKTKSVNGYTYYRLRVYQAVYEAHQNGLSLSEYVRILNNPELQTKPLWTIPKGYEVHHKDNDINNNEVSNLILKTKSEHVLLHLDSSLSNIARYVQQDKIVSISYIGEEKTYDISVQDPHRNFIANGIAIHNCGKTLVGLAIENMLGKHAVRRFDASSMTRAGAEDLILEADPLQPILILEEGEKAHESNFPWMLGVTDDRGEVIKTNARRGCQQKKVKCLIIMTVNNRTKFSKYQEGALVSRFNTPIYFPMPDRNVLRQVLLRDLHLIPNANPNWVDPALEYALEVEKTFSARRIRAIMTNARDRLLTGEYQEARKRMLSTEASDKKVLKEFDIEL